MDSYYLKKRPRTDMLRYRRIIWNIKLFSKYITGWSRLLHILIFLLLIIKGLLRFLLAFIRFYIAIKRKEFEVILTKEKMDYSSIGHFAILIIPTFYFWNSNRLKFFELKLLLVLLNVFVKCYFCDVAFKIYKHIFWIKLV